VPLIVATSGRALKAVVIGSGSTPGFGGSVLWELHLPWVLLSILSRGLPIIISLAIAVWAVRRIGSAVLNPVPLISLVALSFALRLLFEVDIFGYYFMALAVSLVVAWLALVTLVYNPAPYGFVSNFVSFGIQSRLYLPVVGMSIALLLIAYEAIRGRVRLYLVAWFAVTAFAFGKLPLASVPLRAPMPTWFWQIVLVGTGLVLAGGPLISSVRESGGSMVQRENLMVGVR
jgi:hypothetical protein